VSEVAYISKDKEYGVKRILTLTQAFRQTITCWCPK